MVNIDLESNLLFYAKGGRPREYLEVDIEVEASLFESRRQSR